MSALSLIDSHLPFHFFFFFFNRLRKHLASSIEFCVLARLSAYLKRRWFMINLLIEEPSIKEQYFLYIKERHFLQSVIFLSRLFKVWTKIHIVQKWHRVPLYGLASSIIAILSIWKRQWCIIRFIRLHCEKCACMVSSKMCTWNVIGQCWYEYCNSLFAQVCELFKNYIC